MAEQVIKVYDNVTEVIFNHEGVDKENLKIKQIIDESTGKEEWCYNKSLVDHPIAIRMAKKHDTWQVAIVSNDHDDYKYRSTKPFYSYDFAGKVILGDLSFGILTETADAQLNERAKVQRNRRIVFGNEGIFVMGIIGTGDLRCGNVNSGLLDISNQSVYVQLIREGTKESPTAYKLELGTKSL